MIVKYNEYTDDKRQFFIKHDNDFEITQTGSSAEYYTKTYVFRDGAIWYEVMRRVQVEQEVEVYFCKSKIYVDLFETEYWSSTNADSKKCYENWDVR